jgi:hypothetical protein
MKKLLLIAAAVALLVGCKTGPNDDPQDQAAEQAAEQAAPAPMREVRRRANWDPSANEATRPAESSADPASELPEFTGQLENDGYGIDMILDGSSPEAFRNSLELVAMESSEEQYQQIQSAIRYLNHASMAFRDLEVLYSELDGKTAQEVIEMAQELQRQRGG